MSKIKDCLNDEFNAEVVFAETVSEFKSYTEQSAETINQMPLKFLFCFTAGIADASYYLACCTYQKIGVSEDAHKDLANIMFNVAIMLNVRNKNIAVAIIKDMPQKSFTTEIASSIVTWFNEGNAEVYIYQDLMADILDFDQNLTKCGVSLLKNMNNSALKKDFICLPGAQEHLGITSEDILADLIGKRVISDERLSTLFSGSERDEQEIHASYHSLTDGRNNSSDIKVESVGEGSDSFCNWCVIS